MHPTHATPQNASQRPSATFKAWDLIGFDGQLPYEPERTEYGQGSVRIVGGRTRYEAVGNDGGSMVRLSKLKVTSGGLRAIIRYVDPDTPMEFVPEALSASLPRGDTELTENTSPSPKSPQNAPSALIAPLSRHDLEEIERWATDVVEAASGYAERAEATPHCRELMRNLDALARSANQARSMARVLRGE